VLEDTEVERCQKDLERIPHIFMMEKA